MSIDAATNCHWGPSYWCKSKETAEDCQQTVYCEDNVWKVSCVQGLMIVVSDKINMKYLLNKYEYL